MDLSHIQSLLIIGGISGAGKSKGIDALSDFGYFSVENLPVSVLETFIAFTASDPTRFKQVVILPDIRSNQDLEQLLKLVGKSSHPERVKLIYIDCATEVIIRRYSETRRPHPCFDTQQDKTLEDAILRERSKLAEFRDRASLLLETSNWNIHELRRALLAFIESICFSDRKIFRLNFLSFGFKFGLPADCDVIMDARFLTNPFFLPELKDKNGTDSAVANFVLNSTESKTFIQHYQNLLELSLPLYINSGKQYLNIGVGCTGGKHRSVAIAEKLSNLMSNPTFLVSAKHRDIDR